MEKNNKDFIYPLLIFCCAICFSLGGILVKSIPWEAMSTSSGRSLIAAVLLIVYMKIRKHKFVFNTGILIGGCAIGLTGTLYVIANKITTSANAVIIQYTAPAFIILYGFIFLHEKPDKLDIAATVLLFGGIVCMFSDNLGGGRFIGDIIALLSGAAYGVVFMMKKFKYSDTLSSVLVGCIISGIAGLPWLVQETDFGSGAIIGILLTGIVQFGAGYIFMAEGLIKTPPLTASLISMAEPMLNPILAAIFLKELLSPIAIIGMIIIIVTIATYNIMKERISAKVKNYE